MSVRQLSTDLRIAVEAAARETKFVLQMGGSAREAVEAGYHVLEEILKLARQPDERQHAIRSHN